MKTNVIQVDYSNEQQGADLVFLLDSYARDPMGGAEPLSASTKAGLVSALAKLPHAFSVICYVDGKPAGLINCFEAFSTFACKPVVNIHDVVVIDAFRGLGLSKQMLTKVEEIAKSRGCCKLTLEVLEGNKVAQASYQSFGFAGYELDPEMGKAMFWQKKL